jgi:hypothetical protein
LDFQYLEIDGVEFDTYWQNGGYKKISDIIFAECHIFIVSNLWYDPAKARNEFARSNCTYTREFDVIPATGASYWPIIAQCTQVRVKPDILKNSK